MPNFVKLPNFMNTLVCCHASKSYSAIHSNNLNFHLYVARSNATTSLK